MSRVLGTGATAIVGSSVVAELGRRGPPVGAFVREPERAATTLGREVELASGRRRARLDSLRRAAGDGAARGAVVLCQSPILAGVTNAGLRALVAGFLPGYQARQMTYDLRRLRLNGLIERVPGRRRYQITGEGRRMAAFPTKTYARILNPSLAELDPALPPEITARSPLGRAWRDFERALEGRIADAALTS